MKIIVLNGSPKGDISVTMQYINYIQKKFKQQELKVINIAQKLNTIEKDTGVFEDIIKEISLSDGVIWAFPLYVFTVHSQYQRFIELIFERNVTEAFKGKYTSFVATSIHFYDHTAINYMNSICDDLEMNFTDYFSAHMFDLTKDTPRKNLIRFAQNYFDAIEKKAVTLKNYNPVQYEPIKYIPEVVSEKINVCNKKVVVITDSLQDTNLKNMIDKFRASFSQDIELINLEALEIKGGCLGCLKCGYNYECVYDGKDDFINMYNSKLKTADIIVFAGAIKYRHLSASWKRFLDRAFFNTHTPSLVGKQIGFIISGPLRQISNLRQVLEAYVQWQGSNLVGFVTDEYKSCNEIDDQLYTLGSSLVELSAVNYSKPATFLGVGGMKIFRDDIWGDIRFPFAADHKAYKANKVYDFPQKKYRVAFINSIMILLCKLPSMRKEIYSNRIKPSMIVPLKYIVEDPTL